MIFPQIYLVDILEHSIKSQRLVRASNLESYHKLLHMHFFLERTGVGVMLIKWIVVEIYSLQNLTDSDAWKSNALAILRICWCFHSTHPFYWGVLVHVIWWMIPFSKKKSYNSFDKNSKPLSLCRILTTWLNWLATRLQNPIRYLCMSNLFLNKYNQTPIL